MDDDIRALERAAAIGDPFAIEKLMWMRARRGEAAFPQLTVKEPKTIQCPFVGRRQQRHFWPPLPEGSTNPEELAPVYGRAPVPWDQAITAWTPLERGKYTVKLLIEIMQPTLVELELHGQGAKCHTQVGGDSSRHGVLTIISWIMPHPTALQLFVTPMDLFDRPGVRDTVIITKATLTLTRESDEWVEPKPPSAGPYVPRNPAMQARQVKRRGATRRALQGEADFDERARILRPMQPGEGPWWSGGPAEDGRIAPPDTFADPQEPPSDTDSR